MLKKIVIVAAALVLTAIITLAGFAAYLGAFRTIAVAEADDGPFYFVYREMHGNDLTAVGEITTALHDELRSVGITEMRPFDIFQPASSGVPNEIGFVIKEAEVALLQPAEHSIKSRVIARQRYMITTFPFKNRLSFLVGYIKVDPALAKHRTDHGYATAPAIARNDGDTITYLQPIQPAR